MRPLTHQANPVEDVAQEHTVERVGIKIVININQGLQMQVVEARQTHTYTCHPFLAKPPEARGNLHPYNGSCFQENFTMVSDHTTRDETGQAIELQTRAIFNSCAKVLVGLG